MILIILDAPDCLSAEAFIKAEPDHQSGIFEQITISEWQQLLPEV